MTPEQSATVQKLFTRYGHKVDATEIRSICAVRDPAELHETETVAMYDKMAADTIREMESAIRRLTAYRAALAERYSELETAPKIPVVKLHRERRGYGSNHRIIYYLEICQRNLNTGKDVVTGSTRYPGKDRSKAIADYKAYVKAHPGITAELDIEKAPWER